MIKLQLIGYLGKDAIQREVNDKTVLHFRVAHTERFRNQQGVQQEKTTWVDCALWERENLAPYLAQGTQVYAEGFPTVDVFTNRAGETVGELRLRVTNIQLLSPGRRDDERQRQAAAAGDDEALDQPSEELPF
ncbi:single-stranded DNA-binding protein [uncultured Chitinophaga sp.]|jgi:single stranded DNA-binding protein (ssb)|uniref:single-stranded DNA-binding protein n=1 Tax=uncultured Chitinophaga sp. TaxID=339340 RepID=UPI00260E366A|nr:single-stranded DNA-binding protein [uncultured Chitinophaga sp.]